MEEEIQIQEELINLGSLEIAEIVKASQSQNGLKHSDYKRYRCYCSKRIKRIRNSMKFAFGKNKFVKKNIEEVCKNDPKMLLSLLYTSERSWAYAMELKQEIADQIKNKDNRRIRHNVIKKFKRSQYWASKLQNVCQERTNKKSEAESEGYAAYMSACYCFEIEQWEKALNYFIRARQIYSELIKVSDKFQGVIFNEKIEQIDQSIRYCNHKLHRGSKQMSIEELIFMKTKTQDPSLIQKFDDMINENRMKQLDNNQSFEITYHNEQIPIKNEKLLILLQQIKEVEVQLQNSNSNNRKNSEIPDFDIKIMQYVDLFGVFDEALKIVQKDKDDNKDSEGIQRIYMKIQNYFQSCKYEKLLERNELQHQNALNKFRKENGFNNLQQFSQKVAQKSKVTTPFELIRWCDNVINVINQLKAHQIDTPHIEFLKNLEAKDRFYKAISFSKFLETYSLIAYFVKLTENNEYLQEEIDYFKEIGQDYERKILINLYEQTSKEEKYVIKKIESIKIEGQLLTQKSLESLLQSDDDLEFSEIGSLQMIELPPKPELINNRPLFFDLAYTHLRYPDIESKIVQKPRASILGTLGSKLGFGWGK